MDTVIRIDRPLHDETYRGGRPCRTYQDGMRRSSTRTTIGAARWTQPADLCQTTTSAMS